MRTIALSGDLRIVFVLPTMNEMSFGLCFAFWNTTEMIII